MANLVLAVATSHSPLLAIPASLWGERARDDVTADYLVNEIGERVTYAELLARRGDRFASAASPAEWSGLAAHCQVALDELSTQLRLAAPDVVVIVGDDQDELFDRSSQPLVSAFVGETVRMSDALGRPGTPEWLRAVGPAYGMDRAREYRGAPAFASALVAALVEHGVDMHIVREIPQAGERGMGHAIGFVAERLLSGGSTPIVPILLNTFFGPNVPTATRAIEIGRALRGAIADTAPNLRVALVASGGLSHFLVDEALDRAVIKAIEQRDTSALAALPSLALTSGSSEILNWIVVASAAQDLRVERTRYYPVYRTPAGTGCGMGFAHWVATNNRER